MKNKITENGIAYKRTGDYYIPVLELPEEKRSIGKYGRMHRDYLKEQNPMLFNDLVLTGRLWTYLAELNEQAQSRLQMIIRQMQEAENVTDGLKEKDSDGMGTGYEQHSQSGGRDCGAGAGFAVKENRWDWMLLNKSGIQFFSLKIMDSKENSYTEIMEVCMKL